MCRIGEVVRTGEVWRSVRLWLWLWAATLWRRKGLHMPATLPLCLLVVCQVIMGRWGISDTETRGMILLAQRHAVLYWLVAMGSPIIL